MMKCQTNIIKFMNETMQSVLLCSIDFKILTRYNNIKHQGVTNILMEETQLSILAYYLGNEREFI